MKRDGAKGKSLFLFPGSDAIDVAERGIAGAEGTEFRYPVIWNDVFQVIAPLE